MLGSFDPVRDQRSPHRPVGICRSHSFAFLMSLAQNRRRAASAAVKSYEQHRDAPTEIAMARRHTGNIDAAVRRSARSPSPP
jgi:hypothetical protein